MHSHQWSCSLVHLFFLRPLQEWSQGEQPRYLSLWWNFYYILWFRVVFSSSWDTHFSFFLSSLLVWWGLFPIFQSTCKFPFLWPFWFFSWFGSSIHFIICLFPLLIISVVHFSMPNSIPISWLYILTARIRVSLLFSFSANSLMSSIYISWLYFLANTKVFCSRLCIS